MPEMMGSQCDVVRARLTRAAHAVLFFTPLALLTAEDQPKVLREYKNVALIEFSGGGARMLTSSMKPVPCANGKTGCYNERLSVFDGANGKLIGEVIAQTAPSYGIPNRFLTPRFVDQSQVRAVEATWDDKRRLMVSTLLTWDPASGETKREPVEFPKTFNYVCPLDNKHFLGVGESEIWPKYVTFEKDGKTYVDPNDPSNKVQHHENRPLDLFSPGTPVETIGVLTDAPYPRNGGFRCAAWRSGKSFLIEDSRAEGNTFEDGNFGRRLAWYSTEARGAPPGVCRAFENQRIHGYALSPDTTRIAVVTSLIVSSPWRVFLHILNRADCAELNNFELSFPEQPRSRAPLLAPSNKYFDNVPFPYQFARSLAISPDNALLALA
jgi:hypothetical protein